ncbi:DNA-formamidopyrimidine glycosylase family protein [Chitinophaga arvensicola]|uniref:Formamidopyrimidine-DNA glycosylase n=1 Tax=Chitinophaga arvensicola TaxID=29529 RepID=A0A1I0SC90_9BACT|nr:DNA-formamidopyrimidine glycosylase family protein [Chitinophaga arvensicola]SEW54385.1 formamidopyrimidine-DNA glycosylase [Chitinophaga arvensicola]
MPELPDLQAFKHNLEKKLLHKKLTTLTVKNAKKLHTTEKALKEALEGQPLDHIQRVGKELHFVFKNGHVLGMHLMLHGKLYFFDKENEQKYTIVELLFTGGDGLVLTDFQGAANIFLDPEPKTAPDALSKEFNESYLKEQLAKKKINIKKYLLDQHNVLGIGNAYADDILWDAKISPFSICNKIPDASIKALLKSIKKILEGAEKKILKSNPDIINGEVRDFMLVHNAKLTESPDGAPIKKDTGGGRKTYYTDEQVLFE